MSHIITLELPDALYAALERVAQAHAQAPDAWLLAHLPELLPATAPAAADDTERGPWTAEEEAAFEAEWQQYLAETEALRHSPPPSREEARAQVRAIIAEMGGTPLSEEEAIELAMSEEIAEWNLDLD